MLTQDVMSDEARGLLSMSEPGRKVITSHMKGPASLQRKTKRYTDEKGKVWAQDYNFDPAGGPDAPIGEPYPSKMPGGIEIKMSAASEREKLATGAATLSALDNLKSLFDKSYVGPIAGRVGQVKDIFGGNEIKQSEFNAATAALKNQTIKEITGAQMSEVEAKRIMKQVPDVTNPPKVWMARWTQTKKNLAMLRKKRIEIMEASGIRVPEPTPKAPVINDPLGIR